QGDRVRVAVADDGRGLDEERIRARARARGIDTSVLSQAELQRLIFLPGFSTAEKVSALAGRGVGLDVVADALHAMGGSVEVASGRGRGTTVTLEVPLTLSLIKGLVMEVDGETFVVPTGGVVASER